MRTALLLSLLLTAPVALAGQAATQARPPATQTRPPAQTTQPRPPAQTTQPQPPATTPAPAQPAPARRAQPAVTRGKLAFQVTNPQGSALEGIQVEVIGASDRSGRTAANGQLNLPSLQAGTYRLRFSGDGVITFEREVVLRAG